MEDDVAGDSGTDNVGKLSSPSLPESLDLSFHPIVVRDVRLCGTHLSITGTWFAGRTSETIGVSNPTVYSKALLVVSVAGLIPCVRRCRFALERTAKDLLHDSTGQR